MVIQTDPAGSNMTVYVNPTSGVLGAQTPVLVAIPTGAIGPGTTNVGSFVISQFSSGFAEPTGCFISKVCVATSFTEVYNNLGASSSSVTPPAAVTAPLNILPTYTPLPARQPGKNNLVLVTHGMWGDLSWVTSLATAISNRIANAGLTDWQVVAYDWRSYAGNVDPEIDLNRAIAIGTKQIGPQIVQEGWQHVHLIGHSAGAGLIQAAADVIASLATVHTTFLDPFMGNDYRGLTWYGQNAVWSDNYYAHDKTDELGLFKFSLTEGRLLHAHNVDVSWLDPNKLIVKQIDGLPYLGNATITPTGISSHPWPHDFYAGTVVYDFQGCAEASGYGFSLSLEGGQWNNRVSYPPNNQPFSPCGQGPVILEPISIGVNSPLRIDQLPNSISQIGAILNQYWFSLSSSSAQLQSPQMNRTMGVVAAQDSGSVTSTSVPAWLAMRLTVTSAVNFVQFDAQFTDGSSAQGLLTVYWNNDPIGTVDEQVSSPGLQTYRFFLPSTATSGENILSFRLDAFYGTSPSIMVTNVTTGFAGVTEPTALSIMCDTDGTPFLKLTGASNYNFLVQCSTNLVNWQPMALVNSTNGTAFFPDPDWTNYNARFYRALLP